MVLTIYVEKIKYMDHSHQHHLQDAFASTRWYCELEQVTDEISYEMRPLGEKE